jgi:photosystem II stability/assembly factor-like uncharacterized protein
MRGDVVGIALFVSFLLIPFPSGQIAAQGPSPAPQPMLRTPPAVAPGDKLPAIVKRYDEYFARRGTGRGTGYRQYMRGLQFAAPRSSPSGDLVNFTALTWFNHLRAVRSPEFLSGRAAAIAAGVGTGNWRLLGPTQAAEKADAADPGRVNAIAFHPTDSRTLYIGTPLGGLWRTQDDGANWSSLSDGLPMIGISDIAIDPLRPATIYLLTGDGEYGERNHAPPSIGILKSTDGGLHWLPTGLVWKSDQREYGHRLAIHPSMPTILLGATTAGLFRTTDGGATWATVAQGNVQNPFWDILFHPSDPSIVYAASTTNVYRSLDAGQTWTRLGGGLPSFTDRNDPNLSDRIRLGVTPASPDTLYVLYGSPYGFTNGLYRSNDRGNTFTKRSSTNPVSRDPAAAVPIDLTKPNIFGYDPNDLQSISWYALAMAISPTDADRVHVGVVNTWRSDDGGSTWKITSGEYESGKPNYTHADIHILAYRGGSLYAGSDGGVYRSTDGGEAWTSITKMTSTFSIALVYHVCATPQDANLFYYGAQDNGTYRLLLDGMVKLVWTGDGVICQIDPRDSNIVYSSYVNGEIRRSDQGAQEGDFGLWRDIRPKVEGRAISGAWVTPFILGPTNPDGIYACYADLWYSPDRGLSWRNLTNGALGPSKECQQVVVAPSDANTIYVVKDAERAVGHVPLHGDPRTPFLGGGGVFRTTDGGKSWQTITGALPLGEAAAVNMAVSPTDPRRAWVTFSGYNAGVKVFGTTDAGASWTNLSAGLPNLPVNAVAAKNGPANGIYVGLDSGVYYRDDRLNRWVPFTDGLPNIIVISLLIDEARGRLIAGTFGRGVWLSEIGTPCTEDCSASPGPGAPERRELAAPRALPPQVRGSYAGPVDIFQ